MSKENNTEIKMCYNLTYLQGQLKRYLKGESLEEIVRAIYFDDVIQCLNLLDIGYYSTALCILGRTLSRITREYCDKFICSEDLFEINSKNYSIKQIGEKIWGFGTDQRVRLNLLAQKEIVIDGNAAIKLNKKMIKEDDYNTLIFIEKVQRYCIEGLAEDAYIDEEDLDLETKSRNYVELGIIVLILIERKINELNGFVSKISSSSITYPNSLTAKIEEILESTIILECEDTVKQGTAFLLDDIGYVTCNHVLGSNTMAFTHNDSSKKHQVKIIKRNSDIDLAIIEIPGLKGVKPLKADYEVKHKLMDEILVAGFPNYQIGDKGRIAMGKIAMFRMVSTIERIYLDRPIIAGNSGGPIFTSDGEAVIGVAVTGVDNETEDDTEKNGIIPIKAVTYL